MYPASSEKQLTTGVPVLDYGRPERRRPPRWLTARLTPERALVIWVVGSFAFGAIEPRGFYPHLVIGLAAYAIFALLRWRAQLVWKIQALLALILLAVGAELFVAPWRDENFSITYWTVYNQTYRWNRDASLKVAWIPLLGLAWLMLIVVAERFQRYVRKRRRNSDELPAPGPD
jgi:hypothetical protein